MKMNVQLHSSISAALSRPQPKFFSVPRINRDPIGQIRSCSPNPQINFNHKAPKAPPPSATGSSKRRAPPGLPASTNLLHRYFKQEDEQLLISTSPLNKQKDIENDVLEQRQQEEYTKYIQNSPSTFKHVYGDDPQFHPLPQMKMIDNSTVFILPPTSSSYNSYATAFDSKLLQYPPFLANTWKCHICFQPHPFSAGHVCPIDKHDFCGLCAVYIDSGAKPETELRKWLRGEDMSNDWWTYAGGVLQTSPTLTTATTITITSVTSSEDDMPALSSDSCCSSLSSDTSDDEIAASPAINNTPAEAHKLENSDFSNYRSPTDDIIVDDKELRGKLKSVDDALEEFVKANGQQWQCCGGRDKCRSKWRMKVTGRCLRCGHRRCEECLSTEVEETVKMKIVEDKLDVMSISVFECGRT